MAEDMQRKIAEFDQVRAQLMNVSRQKQQLQMQSKIFADSLDELAKTKEDKVYKATGNILILSDTKQVKKELNEQKDAIDLRTKTLQTQEDTFVDKLNKLKVQIEGDQKPAAEAKK